MPHNDTGVRSGWSALGRRLAAALVGALVYVQGLSPYLPGVEAAGLLPGMAGAALVAGASYALLADLSLRGHHRRPNAEVLLVASLFVFLLSLLVAADPGLAGAVSRTGAAALVAGSLLVLLASGAYLARPGLFRDPP